MDKIRILVQYSENLQSKQITTILVSAIFRDEQRFFKPYGLWSRGILKLFSHIFVQDDNSKNLLKSININNVTISGDTRFDRVSTIVSGNNKIELAEAFAKNKHIIVAGSTWPEDEDLLIRFLKAGKNNLFAIIAPHEIHADRIQSLIQKSGDKAVLFSKTSVSEVENAEILIIDSIGMLSQLYRYGTLAYIGGGFGVGIHNILEAAAFGLPVFFGPEYRKFKEANDLIKPEGCIFS